MTDANKKEITELEADQMASKISEGIAEGAQENDIQISPERMKMLKDLSLIEIRKSFVILPMAIAAILLNVKLSGKMNRELLLVKEIANLAGAICILNFSEIPSDLRLKLSKAVEEDEKLSPRFLDAQTVLLVSPNLTDAVLSRLHELLMSYSMKKVEVSFAELPANLRAELKLMPDGRSNHKISGLYYYIMTLGLDVICKVTGVIPGILIEIADFVKGYNRGRNAENYYKLGRQSEKRGDCKGAINFYQEALRHSLNNYEVIYHLGKCYEAIDKDKAEHYYGKAQMYYRRRMNESPDNQTIKKMLVDCEEALYRIALYRIEKEEALKVKNEHVQVPSSIQRTKLENDRN